MLAILLFTLSAYASPCLTLLTGDRVDVAPESVNMNVVREWVERQLYGKQGVEEKVPLVIREWHRWNSVNPAQRELVLNQELDLISPAVSRDPLPGRQRLRQLSRENLFRLISELPRERASEEVAWMASALTLSSYDDRAGALEAPLVSLRERARIGIAAVSDFYGTLLGAAPSVNLKATLTHERQRPYDSVRVLQSEFARHNGFFLPRASHALELVDFFQDRTPEAVDEVASLLGLGSGDELADHLTLQNLYYHLPLESNFEKLRPLRVRLHRYALTHWDATTYFREAMRRYLGRVARLEPDRFARLKSIWDRPGVAERIFTHDVLPFIGWKGGVSLHVPVSIPHTAFASSAP